MSDRNTIYKYVFGVLPTSAYLYKHTILNYIPKCKQENLHRLIYLEIAVIKNKRIDLIREIKKMKNNV